MIHRLKQFIIFIIFGKSKIKNKKDYFLIPLIAILVAVLFRSFVFDHFHVPSGSMKGTLLIGDKIAISSFSYGYGRYSLPFGVIPFKGRIFEKKPERGDIIVFKLPTKKTMNYVKRLIGIPGDAISIKHGIVYINGTELKREKIADFIDTDTNQVIPQYIEHMPNGKSYTVLDQEPNGLADNIPQFVVPENQYFFMGDNRDNSLDSRFIKVGFVDETLLLGRVERVIISSPKSLLNPFGWGQIRWNRAWKKV